MIDCVWISLFTVWFAVVGGCFGICYLVIVSGLDVAVCFVC